MRTVTEVLIEEHKKQFRTTCTNETPTVRIKHRSHSDMSIPSRLLERLNRDGIMPHHRAPDYLLTAAGIPYSIHTACSARYALSIIREE